MLSIFIAKLTLFAMQLLLSHTFSKENYGFLVFYLSIFNFFSGLTGLGSYQGLLRFGAILKNENEKNALSAYSYWNGFLYQIVISILFFVVLLVFSVPNIHMNMVIVCLSIRLVGAFFLNLILVNYRIQNDNKSFALINIFTSVISLIFSAILIHFYGINGFLVSIALSSFFGLFFLKKKFIIHWKSSININKNQFWAFNINAITALLVSEFLFVIDIYFAQYYLGFEEVSNYKNLILIPYNLWIFPQIFLQTDYTKITANYLDEKFIFRYIKNYFSLFSVISLLIIGFSFIVKDSIYKFIFGNEYRGGNLFLAIICFISVVGFTKTLFNYLLSAIGFVKRISSINFLAIFIFIVLVIFLVPKYRLFGLILSTLSSILFSTVCTVFSFFYIYKKIISNENSK